MLKPTHDMLSVRANGMSPRRTATIGTVAAIHALAIYALVSGMGTTVIREVEHEIQLQPVADKTLPTTQPAPMQPTLVQPTQMVETTVPPPVIDMAPDPQATSITVAPTPTNTAPPVDTAAAGVLNTHTTPPYPVAARTAGHQGAVTLQITVGPNGEVANATVVQSSGFPELDQAAVEWVTNHWKYKPAVQGGVAVTSTTRAAVKFDLQQARR
ncbi:MAG: energy transducer TonB [Alphaproteobacteria bacterium]|nr:energy transducer TonB [Alphaproteobacteria bacterium]MBL6940185.1 energy transducer TonB [Alphaproteobacteria bacterium]MBL7100272.1 energy transducer TonB [Alphaproteobacteria bacterium]